MSARVFASYSGDWAVQSDGEQWILQRRRGNSWRDVSFVHSDRDVLARCMREKGVDVCSMRLLLLGLPDTYEQWQAAHPGMESLR